MCLCELSENVFVLVPSESLCIFCVTWVAVIAKVIAVFLKLQEQVQLFKGDLRKVEIAFLFSHCIPLSEAVLLQT